MLFTPNVYTVGAVETITLSVYYNNISQLIVDAELTYTEQKCKRLLYLCSYGDVSLFSRDSGVSMNGEYCSQNYVTTLFITIFRSTCKAQLTSKHKDGYTA